MKDMTHDELVEAFENAYTETFLVPPRHVCPQCGLNR